MNEPRFVESVTNECQLLGRAHESSSARAEQLIACLEGEIVKRDARIAELEVQRGGVVLPPRMSAFADDFPERHTASRWFNSALDEVARLNPPGECMAALCTECGGTLKLAAN